MVPFLLLIVVIVAVGVGVLAVRNRTDQGIESGISSFRREMHALAPRRGGNAPSADRDATPPRHDPDPGVHVIDRDADELRHDRAADDGSGVAEDADAGATEAPDPDEST